jgi:hypothetical protein
MGLVGTPKSLRLWQMLLKKDFEGGPRATSIQDEDQTRKIDSRSWPPQFDCCGFSFYRFSAVTFSTASELLGPRDMSDLSPPKGAKRTTPLKIAEYFSRPSDAHAADSISPFGAAR